jgi:hypothetical protein
MQRKHYRGLSNPQCLHGIELVRSPHLSDIDEEEKKKWTELTGREINFSLPPEASDFASWRNLPNTEFELERHPSMKPNGNAHPRKLLNGTNLSLSTQPSDHGNGEAVNLSTLCNKRKHGNDGDSNSHSDRGLDMKMHPVVPSWVNEFSGVMKNIYGPVTAAKTIYEDDEGFLIIVSLPFADLQKVKVTWKNTPSHGIVKICCVSTAGMPFIKRHNRTFKLTDPAPEHCPPGEFIREISLPTLISEDAKLEAYCDETGTMLEIIVPKHRTGPEEHEVQVCLRPSSWSERPFVDLEETLV